MSKVADWTRAIAQNLVAWVLSLLVGLVALKLAALTPVIAQYAPLSYLAAVLVALVLALAVANLAVSLWHRFLPQRIAPQGQGDARAYDDTELREKVDSSTEILAAFASDARALGERVKAVETLNKAIIDDYQKMLGIEARLDGELDALKLAIQADKKLFQDSQAVTSATINTLFLALQAIRAREKYRIFKKHIEEQGDFLTARVADRLPVKEQDWIDWQGHLATYESAMAHWLDIARGWHPKIEEWINTVDPRSLTSGDFGDIDDLFPGSNQVIIYKTFASKYNNWKRLENHVGSAIEMAAFGGPNIGEILDMIPGGSPTVERVME